jgi:hypothetical protein
MTTDEEKRKRLERYGGIIYNSPDIQESMKQFQPPAAPPPQTVAPEPPNRTRVQLREDYPDISSLMQDIAPQRKTDSEEYHKRSARADALGRALGSLGGFVSADMGGPVAPHQPGRAQEHMDRYEQLLHKYQDEKRAHDMLTLQEKARYEGNISDILRSQDERNYQVQRRDFEYGRGRTDQLSDRDDQRSYIESQRDPEFEAWKKRTDHQYEWQRKLQRESQAHQLARESVGRRSADTNYTVRYEGRDMNISEAHAFEILSRTPDSVLMSVFGTKDVGNLDFAVVGPKMSTLLARVSKDMFIPVPVYDENDKLVGHRLETRTRATSPPRPEDMGNEIQIAWKGATMGTLTPDEVESEMVRFMDEVGGHGMSLEQARQYARIITIGLFTEPEIDEAGNISHPLKGVPIPSNMRLPSDFPRDAERDLYNFLDYAKIKYGTPQELTRREQNQQRRNQQRERQGGSTPSTNEWLMNRGK